MWPSKEFITAEFAPRQLKQARLLAATHSGTPIEWAVAAQAASRADVIIAPASSRLSWSEPEPLGALRQAGTNLPGVNLIDIDELQGELAATLALREYNVEAAIREPIVKPANSMVNGCSTRRPRAGPPSYSGVR